ncbi:hypothetical protein NEUTE2DRAFT_170535, partial [Neurospora tetrasperma FGSC 2509]
MAEAEQFDWRDPGRNPLVTANLTLRGLEKRIKKPCDSDCAKAATRFLGYLRGTQDITGQQRHIKGNQFNMDWDLPVYRLDSFISSCTDDDFTEYTLGQATDWFIHTADASLEHLVDHTIKTCPKKFCRSLKWEGNPDVSGIGV